jgi:hypothetical protein
MLTSRRRTSSVPSARLRLRAGISVVETTVALALFGTVLTSMAGLSLAVAKRANAADIVTKRTGVLQQQMSRLQALPFDSLTYVGGTVQIGGEAFPHRRTVAVMTSGNRVRVTVKIIPTRAPDQGESITFERARPSTSPLCKGC